MDQELQQRLDRIDARLNEILQAVKGASADTLTRKRAKDKSTGIPDPRADPQQYKKAMKKYDTPDRTRYVIREPEQKPRALFPNTESRRSVVRVALCDASFPGVAARRL